MQKLVNKVVSTAKGGTQFKDSRKRFSTTVALTTEDGVTSVNAKRNETGGRRAGSNYWKDEKTLKVADLLCKGSSLESAVFDTYAKHGYVKNTAKKQYRPEIIGHVWGSEYAYKVGVHEGRKTLMRMSMKAQHETPNWEPCYYVDGRMAEVILITVADSERSESPNGYNTNKTNANRNDNIIAWKAGR